MGSVGTGRDAGLYIHVPFCTSVCPYCDFAVTIAGEERRAAWAAGIVREAEVCAGGDLVFDTLYLGGGTPSAIAINRLTEVLDGVKRHLELRPDAWLFLEANPEDVTPESAAAWKNLGVRTVSLGVQAFDDPALAFLGRRHSATDARLAVETLQHEGFATVSIDLIYGLPDQVPGRWRIELEKAVELGVDHLSCYQLTVHAGTVFGRRSADGDTLTMPEKGQAELFMTTHEYLANAGYEGYEVSSFATTPEHRSRHNRKYWDHSPYIGLGPSAHSFDGGRRWWNHRKLRIWQNALDAGDHPIDGEEELTGKQLLLEAVMLGLRATDGLDLAVLRERFDVDLLTTNAAVIDQLCESGHIRVEGERIVPTICGLAIADTLARSFDLSFLKR